MTNWLVILGRRLRAFRRIESGDRDMTDEMQFHIDMEAQDLIAGGMSPDEARRVAQATFGGIMRYREEGRDVRGSSWLADLAQDARHAIRGLRRNRGYATVSILTLALAIGASTTIFGVTNGVLLKPLPFTRPDKLFQVWDDIGWLGVPEAGVTGPEVARLRENVRSFEGVAVIRGGAAVLASDAGAPEQINVAPVSVNLFGVLGRGPVLGRDFLPEEETPGRPSVAIISHSLFRRRFAENPAIIGGKILVDGQPITVVGVLPHDFQFPLQSSLSTPFKVDVYTPIRAVLASFPRGNHTFAVIARVSDDVPNRMALAELARLSRTVDSTDYRAAGFRFIAIPVRERLVREVRPAIVILMAAVGLLVVTMCANLATLALARASRRSREFAVRRALGAGLGRVARQVLTETLCISLAGAALGILLAAWGLKALLALAPAGLPRRDDIGIDPTVVAFTIGLGIVVGVAMGLAPLSRSWRVDISGMIGERAATGRGNRMRGLLVVAQVALSLMLLAGAGLLLASFARLSRVDGGFDSRGAVLLEYSTPPGRYRGSGLAAYHQRVVDRMKALPGVTAVAVTNAPPLSGNSIQDGVAFPESPVNDGRPEHDILLADFMTAGPGYFRTMGIPLIEGREFTAADDSVNGRVVIIDAQLANHYFPGRSALHKRMSLDGMEAVVIGVVGTVHQTDLRAVGRPQVYRSNAAAPTHRATTVIRTGGDEAVIIHAVRAAFHELDPGQPIQRLTTMTAVVRQSLGEARLVLVINATFAVTAILLAVIGIYGVTSATVTARSREMGIRMALGARPGEVQRLLIRKPIGLVIAGAGIGLAGTFVGRTLLTKLLYGVSPTDPATIAAVTVTLLGIALLSIYLPATRAARVDAASVLRAD